MAPAADYHVIKTAKVGGDGGWDYVYADSADRRLYIARSGQTARVDVYDLDSLQKVGEIAKTSARGCAVDVKSGHGFASSKPVAMWDAKTLKPIKTIPVDGRPDGILNDPSNEHVYVFSHSAPYEVARTIGAPSPTVIPGAHHLSLVSHPDQVAAAIAGLDIPRP